MPRIPELGPRGEGWVVLQSVFLVAIPFAAWRATLEPDPSVPGIEGIRAVGSVLLFAGLGLIVLSLAWLRRSRALSALPRPLESGSLVDSGPYRFVRHPVYLGILLAAAGVAMIRVSLLIALLTLLLAVILDLKRRREEIWLRERYSEYPAYEARSKALVPFLY